MTPTFSAGRSTHWLMLTLALTGTLACGGDDDLPEPATCAAGWKIVYRTPPEKKVFALQFAADRLYMSAYDGMTAIAPDGGFVRPVPNVSSSSPLWVENDALVHVDLSRFEEDAEARQLPRWVDELRTTSIEGGPALTAVRLQPSVPAGFWTGFHLTPDFVYAVLHGPEVARLVRFDRLTGIEQSLATLASSESTLFYDIGATEWNGWLLLTSYDEAVSFHMDSGRIAAADTANDDTLTLLGASRTTGQVLWRSRKHLSGPAVDSLAVSQIGETTAPVKLGTKLRNFYPRKAWDDGKGGWLLVGHQDLADGAGHVTVWHVQPDRRARLIACNPDAEAYVVATAAAPDGIYLGVQDDTVHVVHVKTP